MGIKQPNGAHIELFQRRARKHALKKSSESLRSAQNGFDYETVEPRIGLTLLGQTGGIRCTIIYCALR